MKTKQTDRLREKVECKLCEFGCYMASGNTRTAKCHCECHKPKQTDTLRERVVKEVYEAMGMVGERTVLHLVGENFARKSADKIISLVLDEAIKALPEEDSRLARIIELTEGAHHPHPGEILVEETRNRTIKQAKKNIEELR